ncbi:hypothetical protein PVK06_046795 [Gossypium arboreum]|uniref:Uncharacterized protein n=1 Tax=Gossypium arboreum TaxID=29729 RepID=A0ABR0MDI3_GOSAR|nr:hypothetical protein PVK06_046795 [Gossypium arboreum]
MELVDDEDAETIVSLYCEEDGAQEPCMVVPISYVDSQSTIHRININLNAAPETDVVGDDVYYSNDSSNHEVDSDRDPDWTRNQIRRIVIYNNSRAHMSRIDPDAAHAVEFPEYPKILPVHQMTVYSDPDELFVGQRFENHRKLDSKTICTCIMLMVKDIPTIKVSVLIAELQVRFQYRVSYQKAWIAKQMTIEQLYGDFDALYNELQGWITAMQEAENKNVLPIAFAIVDKENMKSLKFFFTNLQRLATLMPRMGQQQVNQMEARHVFVEDVRDVMVANRQMARSMNVEVYSRCNGMFRVTETIGRRPVIPHRSYEVDLRNRRYDCRRF